jgi:hypothetical protein
MLETQKGGQAKGSDRSFWIVIDMGHDHAQSS